MDMKVVFPGGKRVTAHYRGFIIETDQPREQGGEDSAPSPFELCCVSIATCAGYYVLAFCQQRGIPTDNISVELEANKEQPSGMVRKVKLEIQVPPDFPQKYLQAVVNAADTCSVKKHLQNPPDFDVSTRVVEP